MKAWLCNLFSDTGFNTLTTWINTFSTWIGIIIAIITALIALHLAGFGWKNILIKLKKRGKEPYTPWTPVTPPNFVGRNDLLKKLADALEKNESISLVGDRRIGKTSVLKTWEEKAEAQGRLVIYVSGEDKEAAELCQFINKITGQQACNEVEKAADILSDWADKIKPPPLILADEAERFIENFPARFFERLRGMLGRVVWVFATHKPIASVYKEKHNADTSPFDNRLRLLHLGLLEPKAADIIIGWGKFSSDKKKLIGDWAGQHPFYLQLLGKWMLDNPKNINAALDGFQAEAAKHFRQLWKYLSEAEQDVLKGNATGSNAALRELRNRGVLTEKNKIFGKVLEEWLKEIYKDCV